MTKEYCWNCTEDEETGEIDDDGLCDTCRELYKKDGTTFERCVKCGGLIEYGSNNKTKHGDGCTCNQVKVKCDFCDSTDSGTKHQLIDRGWNKIFNDNLELPSITSCWKHRLQAVKKAEGLQLIR